MRLAMIFALVAAVACSKSESKSKPAPAGPAPVTAGFVGADGVRSVPIAVKTAGYVPDQVMAKPGEQLKLVFTRVEPTECGAQVKVDNGPVHDLPMNKPVEIAVTVPASGKVQFACGMDMMTGVVIVGS
jgi:plastocyanin domain-containing protein